MATGNDTNCIAQRGINDKDKLSLSTILSAAAKLAAGYNTAKAVELATEEWKMAKRYWELANNWLDHYRNNYAPVEDQEIREALALKTPEPQYDVARGRARLVAWLEFRGVVDKALRCTSEYCSGLRAEMLEDIVAAQGAAVAMADGMGYRNERAYIEARDDVRFAQQMNTAKRGRDMVGDNVSLARATAGIYGDLYQQAYAGLAGAGYYLGYSKNRITPQYPTTYTATRAEVAAAQRGDRPVVHSSASLNVSVGGA